MDRFLHIQELLRRSRRLPWVMTGMALGTLAGTILLAAWWLRGDIRQQLAGRDGEVLHAVARMEQFGFGSDSEVAEEDIQLPETQFSLLLKTSRIRGVMGARLYDADGRFIEAFAADVIEAELDRSYLPKLRALRPVSRFHPSIAWSALFLSPSGEAVEKRVPVLEVNVPLHGRPGGPLAGIAQYILEGQSLALEFRRLDRNLFLQGLGAFWVSGSVLILAMTWAFRRLRRANRLLEERTSHLLKANDELAMAAKISAVGAVTAHLIHGLRNPLSGLQTFVTNLSPSDAPALDGDWAQAVAAARRMQSMINQVVGVLREQEEREQYHVSLRELAEMVRERVLPAAKAAGVELVCSIETDGVVNNRVAHLVTLILVNLAENGVEAAPRGVRREVRLRVYGESQGTLQCEVADTGPGLAEPQKARLFMPCQSGKQGGSGIGLAISKQLANHLGAGLELRQCSSAGCVFALCLPKHLWALSTRAAHHVA